MAYPGQPPQYPPPHPQPGQVPYGAPPPVPAPYGYPPAPGHAGPPGYAVPPGYPAAHAHPGIPSSPALVTPMRVDVIQGTPFGVAYPAVQSTPSGPAIGSLVAGIASILVALLATCLGFDGAGDGWGLAAGGAFVALGVFLGAGAVALGVYGTRQIRRAPAGAVVTGRGMAITGLVLGCVGGGLALLALLGTALLS